MRAIGIICLFLLGFFLLAAGGNAGGATHQTPSAGLCAVGCVVSTMGLALILSGLSLAKSKFSRRLATVFAGLAVGSGLFQALINLIFQSQFVPTLVYGLYMMATSIAAVLVVRRIDINASQQP